MGALVFGVYSLIFLVLIFRHASYAIVALICMFTYEQWGGLYIPFVAQNGALVNICILLLALISLLRVPLAQILEVLTYPVRIILYIMLVYALLSTSWAPPDALATQRFIEYSHYIFVYAVVVPLLFTHQMHITRVLDALSIVGGVLVMLFAFIPEFNARTITASYDFEESIGLPLALGDFAGAIFLITMIRVKKSFLGVVWALVVGGSAILLITKTGSRGQLAFALAALLLCYPVQWKKLTVNRFLTLTLIVALAVFALLFVLLTENTLSNRLGVGGDIDTGAESRVEMITIVLDAWSSSDILTIVFGLGSSASWSQHLSSYYPHVVPLEILGELGLFGFTLFAIFVCRLFFLAFSSKSKQNLSENATRDFAALFACFVFSLLIATKQTAFILAVDLMMYAALTEKSFRLGQMKPAGRRRRKKKRAGYTFVPRTAFSPANSK